MPDLYCQFNFNNKMAFERILQCFRYNEDKDDEMVAAKALVGLAHSLVPRSPSSTDSDDVSSVPSLDLSLGSLSVNNHDDLSSSARHQDRGTHEKIIQGNSLSPNPLGFGMQSRISSRLSVTAGCKSRRRILREGERETRRLRRVLANRESARQTIRRRQATHEALAKRATDLVLENESLKMEKELAEEKYSSLRHTNDSLKAEVEMTRAAMEGEQEIHKFPNSTTQVDQQSSSTSATPLECNWRHVFIRPSDGSLKQHGTQNSCSFTNAGEQKSPFLVLPFPGTIPFSGTGQYFPQPPDHHLPYNSSSSHVKHDDAGDSNSKSKGSCNNKMALDFQDMTSPLTSARRAIRGDRDIISSSSSTNGHVSTDSYARDDRRVSAFSLKKSEVAIAAMEARKMRKNIMKLKKRSLLPISSHVQSVAG